MSITKLTNIHSVLLQELCTILLATEFAGDEMNFMKFGGLIICLSGIVLHVYYKTVKSKFFSVLTMP